MSTDVTMQELELETAELLPARETLWSSGGGGHNSTNIVGSGDGNTYQSGGGGFLSPTLNVSALNGNFDGDGNFVL